MKKWWLLALVLILFIPLILSLPCGSCADCDTEVDAGRDATLTANIDAGGGGCITINGQNSITVDCSGSFSILNIGGPGNEAIEVIDSNDITIQGCIIGGEGKGGIYLEGGNDTIINGTAIINATRGIEMRDTNGTIIQNSTFGNTTSEALGIGPGVNNLTFSWNNITELDKQLI